MVLAGCPYGFDQRRTRGGLGLMELVLRSGYADGVDALF
jgi:hypothetical protein